MKQLMVAIALLLAGCVSTANMGPCSGGEPEGAGHLRYDLDGSLDGNYTIGNGTISLQQLADENREPTEQSVPETSAFDESGCIWFTVPDGVYEVIIHIPHNLEGEPNFLEITGIVLAPGDFNFTLGFQNG